MTVPVRSTDLTPTSLLVPSTVIVNGPLVAVDEAVMLTVLVVPSEVMISGLKVAMTPGGGMAARTMASANGAVRVRVMVDVSAAAPTCTAIEDAGLADRENMDVTVSASVAAWSGRPVPLAVMVTT